MAIHMLQWIKDCEAGVVQIGAPANLRLITLPTRIFKSTPDFNREQFEGWTFSLIVESEQPVTLQCQALDLITLHAGQAVGSHQYTQAALTVLGNLEPERGSRLSKVTLNDRYWPWIMRLRLEQPELLQIDSLRCELSLLAEHGSQVTLGIDLPVERYQQKTALRFPFKGKGMLIQGGVLNFGHRNRSGQFAIDALGLTGDYAPLRSDSTSPDSYAGWGRAVFAPAAGRVVFVCSDRPDQPVVDESNPEFYAPEYPQGGDPGNYVVIDHGQAEFSMLAHFRQHSLKVAIGQQVAPGDALGELGNSGDSTGPHLHHQLQTGPDWEYSDALPHHYLDGPGGHHDRGWFFEV
jgi:hypothetical protein